MDLYAIFYIAEDYEETLNSIETDFNSALESSAGLVKEYGKGCKFEIFKFQPGQNPLDGELIHVFGDPARMEA